MYFKYDFNLKILYDGLLYGALIVRCKKANLHRTLYRNLNENRLDTIGQNQTY